jgi:hypothetical protein
MVRDHPECADAESRRAARLDANRENFGWIPGDFRAVLRDAPVFSEWTWVALWMGHG